MATTRSDPADPAGSTDFTIAILDGTLASSAGVSVDALHTAQRIAGALGRRPPSWRVIGGSACVHLSGGLMQSAIPFAEAAPDPHSILIVPGLGSEHPDIDLPACVEQRLSVSAISARLDLPDARALITRLRAHHDAGGTIAASCVGVLLLAAAGLLAGHSATTHWALNRHLQKLEPDCRVDVTQMVIRDGRIITAGAAMAQMDLMLALLRDHGGVEVADLVMRYLLLDGRPTQSHYMALTHLAGTDETVRRLETLIEACLPDVPPLAELAARLNVTARTLARRVERATGQTPGAVIQSVRLRRARHLLETTRLPVGEIASRVGYADATALRRLTLKTLHLAPGQIRGRR